MRGLLGFLQYPDVAHIVHEEHSYHTRTPLFEIYYNEKFILYFL